MARLEIAVCTTTLGNDRTQKGDIIDARIPSGAQGTSERHVIWMTVDTNIPQDSFREVSESGPKRKFSMDLEQLYKDEGLDKSRAESKDDYYQPLIGKDPKGAIDSLVTEKRIERV
jgi:hypothetical protein